VCDRWLLMTCHWLFAVSSLTCRCPTLNCETWSPTLIDTTSTPSLHAGSVCLLSARHELELHCVSANPLLQIERTHRVRPTASFPPLVEYSVSTTEYDCVTGKGTWKGTLTL